MKRLREMDFKELKYAISNCRELKNYCMEKYTEQEIGLSRDAREHVDVDTLADLLVGELENDSCEKMRIEFVLHW